MRRGRVRLALSATLLLVAIAAALRYRGADPSRPPENIVVILVDTLRPDHLGVYGYARDTSPEIDRLAAAGTIFTQARSVANWTNPTIKSLFTGRLPQAVMREAVHSEAIRMPLPAEVPTFAELLREKGYRTAALVDHPGIARNLSFDRGFDSFEMLYEKGAAGRGVWGKSDVAYVAARFEDVALEAPGRPFLIYLHVVYPHRPYRAGAPYAGRFGSEEYSGYRESERPQLVNAYDSEIRRTDDLVGRIHAFLAARGLSKNTWTILLSDHGEGFWEHGFDEHGNALYEEAIRVPLILVPPEGPREHPLRVDAPVANYDVFATILDIAGVREPGGTSGVSLLESRRPGAADAARPLFIESAHSHDILARAAIRGNLKYAFYPGGNPARHLLFDLAVDPDERHDLYSVASDRATSLQTLMDAHVQDARRERARLMQRAVEPSAETLDGLRSLGYVR